MQLFREMFVASGESDKLHWHNIDWWYFFRWMLHRILLFLGYFWEISDNSVIYWLLLNVFLRTKEFPKYLNLFSLKIIEIESFACLFKLLRLKSLCKLFKLFILQNFSFPFSFVVTFKPTQSTFWPRKGFESWLIDLLLLVSYRTGEFPSDRVFS